MTTLHPSAATHQEVMPNYSSHPGWAVAPIPPDLPRTARPPTSARHRSSRRFCMSTASAQLAIWLGMFAAAGTLGALLGNWLCRRAGR